MFSKNTEALNIGPTSPEPYVVGIHAESGTVSLSTWQEEAQHTPIPKGLMQSFLENVPELSNVELIEAYDVFLHNSNSRITSRLHSIDTQYVGVIESWFLCRLALMLRDRGLVFDYELSTHCRGLILRIEDFYAQLRWLMELDTIGDEPPNEFVQLAWLMKATMHKAVEVKSLLLWLVSNINNIESGGGYVNKRVLIFESALHGLRNDKVVSVVDPQRNKYHHRRKTYQLRSPLEALRSFCHFLNSTRSLYDSVDFKTWRSMQLKRQQP